jgi:hypothetical protein
MSRKPFAVLIRLHEDYRLILLLRPLTQIPVASATTVGNDSISSARDYSILKLS